MRRHSAQIIRAVKADRARGFSISELINKHSLPKTTIWHHIRGVGMPERKWLAIKSRQGGSAARTRREWAEAKVKADGYLRSFNERISWPTIFAALYWCEGTKKGGFVFTNTDGAMVKVFLKILQKYLFVRNEELDILIRTCVPMDSLQCRKYWSSITRIPIRQIRINHNDKHNKSKTQFGMCRITLKKGSRTLKLAHCLIRGLADKMLLSH